METENHLNTQSPLIPIKMNNFGRSIPSQQSPVLGYSIRHQGSPPFQRTVETSEHRQIIENLQQVQQQQNQLNENIVERLTKIESEVANLPTDNPTPRVEEIDSIKEQIKQLASAYQTLSIAVNNIVQEIEAGNQASSGDNESSVNDAEEDGASEQSEETQTTTTDTEEQNLNTVTVSDDVESSTEENDH